jgi:hypothetical protein
MASPRSLEVPERAKALPCKAVPTCHEIWIAAGRLSEQEASLPTKTPAATLVICMLPAISVWMVP